MDTADAVIARTGIREMVAYSVVRPLTDAPGFSVERPYPTGAKLSRVVNRAGQPIIVAQIHFVVDPTAHPSGTRSVRVGVRAMDRSKTLWRGRGGPWNVDFSNPAAPTPESFNVFRRAPRPLQLDFNEEFVYDGATDSFLDKEGRVVTASQMLNYAYDYHCRTLRWRFRLRWRVSSLVVEGVQRMVWRGQDACLWLLFSLYDIELAGPRRGLFHKYARVDFRRTTEPGDKPSFFGFTSSRRSFFSNLAVVAVAVVLLYYFGPRTGFVRAIYKNDALTTAALVFGFLVADVLVPALLISAIAGLSRLRWKVAYIIRKVRA